MESYNHDMRGYLVGREPDKELQDLLKKNLNAIPVDRHPDAMLNELLDRAENEEFGNRKPVRMKQRQAKRIIDRVNEGLRRRYGKYANICNYRVRNGVLGFTPNITHVYRSPGGQIFGNFSGRFSRVFFTSHSIERFEERTSPGVLDSMREFHRKGAGVEPTALDLLRYGFRFGVHHGVEFARDKVSKDSDLYVNLGHGSLVFNRFETIFVARTFLSAEMMKVKMGLEWFASDFDKIKEEDPFDSFVDNCYPINGPCVYDVTEE